MGKKIFLIILFGFLLYFNSLFNSFIWDDEEQVVLNSQIHSFKNLPLFWQGSTFNPGGGQRLGGLYYKPMMTTAFSLIYGIFGPHPFFFHLFQIGLHIANAIILFLIFRYLLKKEWLSFILAVIFLVHPINTETVVYIAALQDTLFFFFGALAFLILIKKEDWRNHLITAGLLLLSIFAKETGVIWFAVCGLYVIFFKRRQILSFIFPIIGAVAIYAYMRFEVAHIFFEKHGLTAISTMDFTQRLVNMPAIAFFYIKTLIWPINLAIDQQWVVQNINFQDFFLPLIVDLVFLGTLLASLTYLWFKKRQKAILYLFFLLFFLLSFGLHLQVFPLDLTVSERWFYLPLAGLLGMIGIFVEENRKVKIFLLMVISLLAIRTFVRTFNWRNGLTLYGHDIKISQNAFDLENNFGVELFRAGKYDDAKGFFEKSIELAPSWWTNYNNLGAYWERKGELEKAERLYKRAIDNGNYYLAYQNYAFVLLKQDKYKEVVEFLEKNINSFPENSRLVTALATAYYQTGQKEKALNAAKYLFDLEPSYQNKSLLDKIQKGESGI